ncbi:alpha/beta fold hydrolase [Rhodococcus maanshanensis]|uniref:Pimeloyl-ACP methyl ester carboxylesterase n=1 Tax=Rhodococcus maanshanensis TaxID=183556 RepID=A0A1H7KII2_9NOCA|nr:Pimeloyl-ACP methyl ester carboxylesterase [Rhodococcus maanshanensis]
MLMTATTADDVELSFRDSGGDDPVPVILVHGMGGDSHTWDRFARTLVGRGRRVIALDLRGHGRSAHAPSYLFAQFGADLLHLCDHLLLERVDLVGHSLGGHTASLVAQARPDLVRRLVLEEAPLPLRTGETLGRLSSRLPTPVELWHAVTGVIRHPRAVLTFDRSMTRSALAQFREPNPVWWQNLSDIAAPTLVISGGPGGMVDPDRLAAATAAIPRCQAITIKVGHSVHRDRPNQFEAAVTAFLED